MRERLTSLSVIPHRDTSYLSNEQVGSSNNTSTLIISRTDLTRKANLESLYKGQMSLKLMTLESNVLF